MSDRQVYHDPVLGDLAWNQHLGWWESKVEWQPGQWVPVALSAGDLPLPSLVERVRPLFLSFCQREDELRRAVADELLELHNNTWNEGEPIDRLGFVARLTVESLVFYADASAELYFDDGDLFWGHVIIASINPQGQMEEASIAG